jgi:ADP-ribose pyrophosphatase YjhB (NUDIX family)
MDYRFCPVDAGPLVSRVVKPGDPPRLVCERCEHVLYLDPKVAAGTLFSVDGRLVLLKRGIEPAYGKWVFPGGFVDRGETVADAAVRETWEEACVRVRADRLVGLYSYTGWPVVVAVYAATIVGGTLAAGDETLEVGLFADHEVPWDDLAFRSTRDAVRDYLARPGR